MIIVFYAGYYAVPLSPLQLNTTGLGGTEQCIIHLSTELAKDSDIEVYVTGDVENLDYSNVKYRDKNSLLHDLGGVYVDCVIGVSYINFLLELDFLNFKNSLFWVHNTDFYPWHRGEELPNGGRDLLNNERIKHIVCLTDWHKQNFASQFPEIESKLVVIGNGIDLNSFKSCDEKIPNSFVYTSHSERGLQKVINDWSYIKKIKPNATLHISTPEYGMKYFQDFFIKQINEIDDARFYGTLSKKNLYELMSKCEYWYYPTEYEETFCITALEMLGHQIIPIANECAALTETLNGFNVHELKYVNQDINWKNVKKYLKRCDWSEKKLIWTKYIYNMETHELGNLDILTEQVESVSADVLPPPVDPLDLNSNINSAEEFDNAVSSESHADFRTLDCVYILSSEINEDKLQEWKTDIRSRLLPWYDGPIIGKQIKNSEQISDEWLLENNYELFDEEIKQNEYSLGNSISHYQTWKHIQENEFSNALILSDNFLNIDSLKYELLQEVTSDIDLVYIGNELNDNDPENEYVSKTLCKPNILRTFDNYILTSSGVESLLQQNFNTYIFDINDFLISCFTGHWNPQYNFIVNDLKVCSRTTNTESVSDDIIQSNDSNKVVDSNDKLHSDLYSYWDDPDAWKQKFISYSARTQEWSLIMDEPFDNCFSMPLFTQEFCEKIREEAEHSNNWTTDRHEFYPTTDMLLEDIGMDRIYYEVLKEYVMPASIYAFQLDGKGWQDMNSEDFLAKYQPNAQGHLSLHHDHSNITALVTLSNFEEYEGGGTYFSHQKKLVKEKQGYVSIHPGNITHKHGARATTKGTRYIIVSFMKNSDFMK